MNSMLNKHTVAIITLESSALPRAGKYTSLSDIIIELDSIMNLLYNLSFYTPIVGIFAVIISELLFKNKNYPITFYYLLYLYTH